MKPLFRIMTLFLTLFCFAGCDDDEEVLSTLNVTAANLDGTWKLVEWNGAPLQAGSYCYITFNRKNKTYKMYDKFDTIFWWNSPWNRRSCQGLRPVSKRVVLRLKKKRI